MSTEETFKTAREKCQVTQKGISNRQKNLQVKGEKLYSPSFESKLPIKTILSKAILQEWKDKNFTSQVEMQVLIITKHSPTNKKCLRESYIRSKRITDYQHERGKGTKLNSNRTNAQNKHINTENHTNHRDEQDRNKRTHSQNNQKKSYIITLNVSRLNSPIKWCRLIKWIKKTNIQQHAVYKN